MKPDDRHLIQQALSGHKPAVSSLYERHEGHWFRLCLRYGENRTEAQDIFQEGVLRIFDNLHQFDPNKGAFPSWSNRIMVNEALKYLKRHQWQKSFTDLSEAENHTVWSETVIEQITARELTELIQQLPFGYRMVFNMYEIEGYTHVEIAEALEISVGTSKSQLSKAKKKLQQQLKLLFDRP